MKSIPLLALAPILALSAVMAGTVEPSVGPFPYQQSWKISSIRGHGTMFPVQKLSNGTIFMTAKHVVLGIGPNMVAFHPDFGIIRTGIRVVKTHPYLDIATIFVPVVDKRIRSVLVGQTPKLGDRCTVVAYPGPGHRRITEGNICGQKRMSAQIVGGSSGGPVFDETGRLIGVVRAVDVRNMGFAQIQIAWMGYYVEIDKKIMAFMLRG